MAGYAEEKTSVPEDHGVEEPITVVVTARGFEEDAGEAGRRITALDNEQIMQKGGQTLPDALDEEAGIWVQKTNLGGGSPFIRGLTGKQVLILIDGIRLNNSVYRYGPNQYLNTVDFTLLKRLEVLHGPGSVIYGSDAIGGVINLLPWPADTEIQRDGLPSISRTFTQYSSADRGLVTHFDTSREAGDFWHSAGLTYMHFDDLRAGRGDSPVGAVDVDGVQPFTGYEGCAGSYRFRYAPPGPDEWRVLFTATRLVNVPRSDKVIESDYNTTPEETYLYDPQELQFGYVEWNRRLPAVSMSLKASFNRQYEGRIRRKDGWTKVRYETDLVETTGLVFTARLPAGNGQFVAGADTYHDWVASIRHEVEDGTGTVTPLSPRFPDGTTYFSGGIFADYRFPAGKAGLLDVGARYSLFRFEGDFQGLVVGPVGPLNVVTRTYQDVTAEASYCHTAGEETEWYLTAARGFRAPNVDDIAVNGDWSSGNDIPNPDLEPEKVISAETGVRSGGDTQRGTLSAYCSWHNDLIAREWVDAGADGIAGTSDDLYQFQNIARAVIAGVEASLDARLAELPEARLSMFAGASYTYGQNLTDDEPVRRIPPLNGTLGLRLTEATGRWWCELFGRFAARQDRLSSGDISDARIPAGGTPGWATVNLRGGIRPAENLSINLALMNLGDLRYRYHGSGIDAPGFNAVLSAEIRF